jgi:hypothetical protein
MKLFYSSAMAVGLVLGMIAGALTPVRKAQGQVPAEASVWTAPDGRTVEQLIAAHVLPDPALTPGVLNPAVTPATIAATICVHGWTATVRPSGYGTDRLRDAETPAGFRPLDGELDHLVSIEDGGAPADPKNLWWMVYADRYGARVKDVLETMVSRAVCAGRMTLDQARAALSTNWLIGYQTYVGSLPK